MSTIYDHTAVKENVCIFLTATVACMYILKMIYAHKKMMVEVLINEESCWRGYGENICE